MPGWMLLVSIYESKTHLLETTPSHKMPQPLAFGVLGEESRRIPYMLVLIYIVPKQLLITVGSTILPVELHGHLIWLWYYSYSNENGWMELGCYILLGKAQGRGSSSKLAWKSVTNIGLTMYREACQVLPHYIQHSVLNKTGYLIHLPKHRWHFSCPEVFHLAYSFRSRTSRSSIAPVCISKLCR